MRNVTRKLVYCLLLLVILTNLNLGQRKGPSKTTTKAPPMNDAESQATTVMTSLFTRCGQSFYYYHYDWHYSMGNDPILISEKPSYLSELKGVNFYLKLDKLTTADKLNGLEWRGDLNIQCEAGREFRDGRWGRWRDECGLVTRFVIGLEKRINVPWKVSRHIYLNYFGKSFPPEPKPKCDALAAPFQ